MSRLRIILVLLVAVGFASAQESPIRYFDFKNFTYPWTDSVNFSYLTWHWTKSTPETRVRLSKGLHKFIDPHAPEVVREHSPALRLSFISYGDLDGDGIEEAAVALNYTSGGTQNWDFVYVYKLNHGKPKLLGRLETGSRADSGLIHASVKDGLLTLDLADPERRVGDCCSEGFIRVHYRWRDGQFVEEGPRQRGDLESEAQ
jgi:hypothetical protein